MALLQETTTQWHLPSQLEIITPLSQTRPTRPTVLAELMLQVDLNLQVDLIHPMPLMHPLLKSEIWPRNKNKLLSWMIDLKVDLQASEAAKTSSSCSIGDSVERTTMVWMSILMIWIRMVKVSKWNLPTTCNWLTLRMKQVSILLRELIREESINQCSYTTHSTTPCSTMIHQQQ